MAWFAAKSANEGLNPVSKTLELNQWAPLNPPTDSPSVAEMQRGYTEYFARRIDFAQIAPEVSALVKGLPIQRQ